MSKHISTAAIVIAVVGSWMFGVKPAEGVVLLGSFENNLSSPIGGTWEGPGIPTSSFVSTGATEGSSALALHSPQSWNIQAILKGGLPLAQAVAENDFLLVDVTTTDQGVAGDGWSPAWRALITVFNSNQGGWQQTQLDFPVAGDDGGSNTQTVILDLGASGVKANAQAYVASGGGAGTYWELFLPIHGADQGTPVKAGDYAADNVVTAGDYVNWRKNFGGTTLSNETVSLGTVDQADYDEWKRTFGTDYTMMTTIIDNVRLATAGSGALLAVTGIVPEPATAMLTLIAIGAVAASRRARR